MPDSRTLTLSISLLVASFAVAPAAFAQPETSQPRASVTPPQVIEHVDAIYPAERLGSGADVTVIVTVIVERDGTVSDASIASSGGADFDQAALSAVRRWRFAPATKEGAPVRARIRVPFHFAPGPHTPAEGPSANAAPKPSPAGPPAIGAKPASSAAKPSAPGAEKPAAPKPDATSAQERHEQVTDIAEGAALPHSVAEPGQPIEIHVQGRPTPPRRGGSDFRFDRQALTAAPHTSAADMLSVAPGMHVMHTEGEAVAQRVVLRGFDADHGQDVEIAVNGVPMNQASHVHGQGYSDLNAIVPETVRSLRVLEGPYDPRQGDFAVAGTVEYDLGVPERGVMLQGTYGSFNTARVLGLWAPHGDAEETFAAAAFRRSDGFGDGTRAGISGALTGQYRMELRDDLAVLAHVAAYGARQRIGGVLRRDDVLARRAGFYDTYADPSAQAQLAATSRAQASVTIDHAHDDGAGVSTTLWFARTDFLARLNFTGYLESSAAHPEWGTPGDLIEQTNRDTGFGARFSLKTKRVELLSWLAAQASFGADARADSIDQAQDLLRAPENQVWDKRINASIEQTDIGLYGEVLLSASKYARLRAGFRGDFGHIAIEDHLANAALPGETATHLEGAKRTAAGITAGPRASLEVDALPWLRAHAAYGQGYRSPQALPLVDGEPLPFTKVNSYEAGLRLHDKTGLSFAASVYETRLSEDLAFEASEGALERIGPTTRRGLALRAEASPISGFFAAASATYVRATLDADGEEIPFVSPVLMRADMSYERTLATIAGAPLQGRAGYGATFLAGQPLPDGTVSEHVFLLDASLSLRRSFLEVGVDVQNLLNAEHADTQFLYSSAWRTTSSPTPEPARHFTAGPPLTALGHITLHL